MNSAIKKLPKAVLISALLLAVLIAASAGLLIYRSLTQIDGAAVTVRINGRQVARYSLEKDGTYVLNGGTNILVIENRTARMSEADCPDKICVNTGRVGFNGQTITCLPNRITVTVEESDSGIDIAAG